MFTAYKIPRGPCRKTRLKVTRVTEGIDDLGQKFVVEDNWTDQAHAHALRERAWVGRTAFVFDPEEDANLGGDCRRQRARATHDHEHIAPSMQLKAGDKNFEHIAPSLQLKAGDEKRSSRVS